MTLMRILNTSLFAMGLLATAGFMSAGSESFGNLMLYEISPRIITPNNDFKNDKVFFRFDSDLTGIPVKTTIFDLAGAEVASLKPDLAGHALSWDGKDNVGRVVPSGIYLYQITIGKKSVSGTIVVAK